MKGGDEFDRVLLRVEVGRGRRRRVGPPRRARCRPKANGHEPGDERDCAGEPTRVGPLVGLPIEGIAVHAQPLPETRVRGRISTSAAAAVAESSVPCRTDLAGQHQPYETVTPRPTRSTASAGEKMRRGNRRRRPKWICHNSWIRRSTGVPRSVPSSPPSRGCRPRSGTFPRP